MGTNALSSQGYRVTALGLLKLIKKKLMDEE